MSKSISGIRYTTVNTDAGVKDGVGAIAYWIRSDSSVFKGSKRLKTESPDSTYAEIAGIITALLIVIGNHNLRTSDRFVVNCDSRSALQKVETGHKLPEVFVDYRTRIFAVIPIDRVIFRWVRGHTQCSKPRSYINRWCDQQVRSHYVKKGMSTSEG